VSDDEIEFEVGKRYRLSTWGHDTWVDPIAIGDRMFFARNQVGEEGSYEIHTVRGRWAEVEIQPDIPEQFFNVYDEPALATRADADKSARPGRLGVVSVRTASYGGDRAEFTRVRWVPEKKSETSK